MALYRTATRRVLEQLMGGCLGDLIGFGDTLAASRLSLTPTGQLYRQFLDAPSATSTRTIIPYYCSTAVSGTRYVLLPLQLFRQGKPPAAMHTGHTSHNLSYAV